MLPQKVLKNIPIGNDAERQKKLLQKGHKQLVVSNASCLTRSFSYDACALRSLNLEVWRGTMKTLGRRISFMASNACHQSGYKTVTGTFCC